MKSRIAGKFTMVEAPESRPRRCFVVRSQGDAELLGLESVPCASLLTPVQRILLLGDEDELRSLEPEEERMHMAVARNDHQGGNDQL